MTGPGYTFRNEAPGDHPAVAEVNRQAFGGRDDEARLVERLRKGGYARVSMVAEFGGRVVAHVLFSDLPIVTARGIVAALALAPMAVVPEFQSRGVGSALGTAALERCRAEGHRIVVVLGHPGFYPRFGFSAALARQLESPYSGEAFMALELVPGAMEGVRGRVQYPPPFEDLE
jgi:putative acetyltransferase